MRTLLTREAVAQRFNLKSQLTANSSQRNINSVWQYHPGAIAKSTPTKMETTKRTAAETTPSNNHTSSPNHLSNSNDKSLLVKQQKDIDYVIKKVRYLEGKISELKGCLFFTQQVNSLSAAKIDCQEHYSRRPCFVISRMNEPDDDINENPTKCSITLKQFVCTNRRIVWVCLTILKFTETLARESETNKYIMSLDVMKNIDKTYPIDKIDEKGLQRKIVKSTSDSFKEKVFKKHKKNKKLST